MTAPPQGPHSWATPQPPRKHTTTTLVLSVTGAALGGLLFGCAGGIAGADGNSTAKPAPTVTKTVTAQPAKTQGDGSSQPQASADKGDDSKKTESELRRSQLDQLKAYANKHGTPQQKIAVGHIVKLDVDSNDIYTDYTGDMFSDAGNASKLITAIYKEWRNSDGDGASFISVYNESGETLGFG